jgi:hypothetical protein
MVTGSGVNEAHSSFPWIGAGRADMLLAAGCSLGAGAECCCCSQVRVY